MKKVLLAVVLAAGLIGCGPIDPQIPPPEPTPQAFLALTVNGVIDPSTLSVALDPDGSEAFIARQDTPGRFTLVVPPGVGGGAVVTVTAPGYVGSLERLHLIQADGSCQEVAIPLSGSHEICPAVTLTTEHFDPTTLSLQQLAAIRGAMWTARWDGAYGPRPGQPDNILSMGSYRSYPRDEKDRMLRLYKQRGYTHAVCTVPWGDGYHGQYPSDDGPITQARWDDFLDSLQEWYDAGIYPVFFAHPDNWSLEDMDRLRPFYEQSRAQKLLRIVVYTGWEPTRYGWSSNTWQAYLIQATQVFPNALHLVHTVVDVDALVGTDERGDDNGKISNGDAWAKHTPYLHGWLTQLGAFGDDGSITKPAFEAFKRVFDENAGGDSYTSRFRKGYAGWPTGSAWGFDKPLLIYYGEGAAYASYWYNVPEAVSIIWGDAAMAAGADGYLDGGSVPVPIPNR